MSYRSSIPKTARERIVATFIRSPQKYKAEYRLNRKVVGVRFFHESGELETELPLKDGVRHGIVYLAHIPGKIISAEPYSNGLPHGTARQFSDNGKLIGTYTMKHGTESTYGGRRSPPDLFFSPKLVMSEAVSGTGSSGG